MEDILNENTVTTPSQQKTTVHLEPKEGKVRLDADSVRVVKNIHPLYRDAMINLAIKSFEGTPVYKPLS